MYKIFFVAALLFATAVQILAQNTAPRPVNGKKKVGWIQFDAKRDNRDFKLCDENNIQEYYQVGTRYGEGLKSVRRFFQQYAADAFSKKQSDGYLTIRFVVNCNGETDRYRVWATDLEMKPQQVPPENEQKLTDALRKMGNWQPGERDGKIYDTYAFLTFKILNGKITDILP
jgi:hypothetical protein